MEIRKIPENEKNHFMALLLLGDEQGDMVCRYLPRGELFALYDPDLKGVCVVTREAEQVYELKNIAVNPSDQGSGYGRALLEFLFARYGLPGNTLLVGTGDVPSTVGFYEHCGFIRSHTVPDFFTDHYDHPIYEDGILLRDMVYLKKVWPCRIAP